jgi:hypothetical protein
MKNGRNQVFISDFRCSADVAANRFVGYDGDQAGAGDPALGVAERKFNAGELVDACIGDTAFITLGETLNPGDAVTSDANGKAVAATAGDAVNGRLLEGGDADDVVEMLVEHDAQGNAPVPAGESFVLAQGSAALNGVTPVDVAVAGATNAAHYQVTHLVTPTGVITITPGAGKFTIVSDSAGDHGTFHWLRQA